MYAFNLSDNQLTEVDEDIDPDTLFGQLVWLESGSGMPIDLCVLTGNVVEGKTVGEHNRNYIRIFRTE